MKRVVTIAIAVSLLVGSCVASQPKATPTIPASEAIEPPLELLVTITPSATTTWTPRPAMPTKTIITATTAAPTFTTTATPELVTLDCSPAFHLVKLGVSQKPQAPIDVAVHDKIAYVLDREGLWVVDVSDPTHPIDVGFIPMLEPQQVIVEGGYAIGVDAEGFWVFDLINPIAPEFIRFKDTPDVPLELSINEGFAYVRDDHGLLRIFDLANPTSITEVGVYDPPGQILSGEIYGNTIARLRGLANNTPLPSFSLSGEYIYVADLDGGLRVIDISDPRRPTEIGSNPLQISDVEVVGDQAYIFEVGVGPNSDQWVLSISTPTTLDDPTHLGMLQLWWNMTSSGLCSFISGIYSLLMESEVSRPGIAQINPEDFIAPLKGVDILGDIVYVADEEEGLVILQMIPAGE
jgi:hypothetical protein